MADLEKETDESTGTTEQTAQGQASVHELVKDVGAALEVFAEQTEVAAGAEPVVAEAAPLKSGKKSKKKSSKKKGLEAVEWNDETAKLDFVESTEAEQLASETTALNAFEELARRVADTVSRKNSQDATADEPSPSEVIASALEQTADALTDTSAELEAESMAAALPGEAGIEEMVSETYQLAFEGQETDTTSPSDSETAALIAAELGATDEFDKAMELEFGAGADGAGEGQGAQLGFDALAVETAEAEAEAEAAAAVEAEAEGEAADNDAAAEPKEFIEADQVVSIIESLLFSTDKPVSIATIKQIFKGSNIRTKDIQRALDSLASDYASSTRGVTLEEINGGYQLRTKSDNTDFLRRLAKTRPFRLSGPALEVLSIVAYKQPVSKHEVDEIRGVESGHLIRALMERSLISFAGKSETLPGKPMTYGTTRKFLEIFGLRNLRELPTLSEIEEILPEGIGEEVEKESLSDLTDRMSTELTSSYSEGEDELNKITEQLKQVDTTSEFFEQEKQRERDRKDRERAQDIRERIVLGDNVEEKDRKWLDRYEAKLHAAEQAALSGVPVTVSADEASGQEATGEGAQIGVDLVALSDEARVVEEAKAAAGPDEDEEALDRETAAFADSDADMDDELIGNSDWDEESESGNDV